jgi:hypothetical protein
VTNDILREILSRTPSGLIYHYTNQSGLLGIVRNGELWATHNQYLNDRKEFLHALEFARSAVDDLLAGPFEVGSTGETRRNLLYKMRQNLRWSLESVNICVASFSEDGDSLSQWRAYGGHSGFALGFQGERVRASADAEGWYLAPCIYDWEQQKAIVVALIHEVIRQVLTGEPIEEDEKGSEVGNLFAYLYRYAPILKDRAFREEKEWRIISRPLHCTTKGFDYREGRSALVPYFRFPVCKAGESFPLREVVVGPTQDQERSQYSLESFLASKNIINRINCAIRGSSVPYRDW